MNTTDKILQTLDYIIYKKENDVYKQYITKVSTNCNEYCPSIEVLVTPRTLYILTDNIKENRYSKILTFYIDLLYNIHNHNNGIKMKIADIGPMGRVQLIKDERKISIIRGDTFAVERDANFEIWIYTDNYLNGNETRFINNINSMSHMASCRLVICESKKIKNKLSNPLCISLYLDDI